MKNGRCRLHGGLSSGPKTAAGIERIRSARLKHGRFTKAAQEEHALLRELIREAKEQLSDLFKDTR
jgi:hypothetical protein